MRILGFNLFRSKLKAKAGAQSKVGTDTGRHHVLTNPFHAVSIRSPSSGCAAAKELEGKRFLSSEAPVLPVPGCTAATCICKYMHHEDRREGPRRSSDVIGRSHGHWSGMERRRAGGRRITDL